MKSIFQYKNGIIKIFKQIILITILAHPSILFSQTGTWIQQNDIGTSIKGGPPYDFQHSTFSFSIGNRGYVGILSDTNNVTFVFEYDPTTNNWAQKASLPGTVRLNCFSFSIGSKGYVGGGTHYLVYDGLTDFWEFDPIANTWTQKANLPFGVQYASGFSVNNKGYFILGSATMSGITANSKQLWEYNAATDAWSRKSDYPGIYRYDQVAFTIDNLAYAGLGRYNAGGGNEAWVNDIWEYNAANDTWMRKADYAGVNRYNRTGIGLNGKGYVGIGGLPYLESSNNEFWEFDPKANTWVKKKDFFDDIRYSAVSFVINNTLYVGLGIGRLSEDGGESDMNDLWKYNNVNDNWSEERALKYEYAKCSFKIGNIGYVLVDKYNYSIKKSELALLAYNTITKTWERKANFPSTKILSPGGAFSIENKAYVVGGINGDLTVSYKDVYEYDPALDKWAKKADFGGEGRGNMSTFAIDGKGYAGLGWVWTSLGGLPYASKINDFWEYDPKKDSWIKKADIPASSDEVAFFNTDSNAYVINSVMQLFQFNPKLNVWNQKNNFPGSPRTAALGMNIGDTGYVFGGTDDVPVNGYYVYLKDLWEYNSKSDSWLVHNDFPGYERSTNIGFGIDNNLFLGGGMNQTMYPDDWWEYSSATILPVRFVNINASLVNKDAIVTWQVANESNVAYYSIERSIDAKNFTAIGSLLKLSNSASLHSYTYTDFNAANINAKNIYYRLQEVDEDGKQSLSKVMPLNLTAKNYVLNIWPAPAKDLIHVSANNTQDGKAVIYSMNGKQIMQQQIKAGNTAVFNLNNISAGTYFIKVYLKDGVLQGKFIKE